MKKRIALIMAVILMAVAVTPVSAAIPTTAIAAVVEGESVTIQTANFPAGHTFHVFMGFNGTHGVSGYLVSKLTTGEGGSFKAKFPIPEELGDEDIIAVRFESVTDAKYYSYNWFYNKTGSGDLGCSTCSANLPYGFPTFDILSVARGQSVSIRTRYLPAETRWAVLMKNGASSSITWYEVAGIETAEGNVLHATFDIPEELRYAEKIAIKLYSINSGFVTYNLFTNSDQ